MSITCCYHCKSRYLGCHEECQEYISQKEEHDRKRELRNSYKYLEGTIVGLNKRRASVRKRKKNYC